MHWVTSLIDGNGSRRGAWALIGTPTVALAGVGSGIANLRHVFTAQRRRITRSTADWSIALHSMSRHYVRASVS
jgi:hypothetical protein